MDQLKTQLLNIRSAASFKESHSVFIFVSLDSLSALVMVGVQDEVQLIDSKKLSIGESLMDTLPLFLDDIIKNKKIDNRFKFLMIMDDNYLKLNRYNFSENQLKNIPESILMEFDQLPEYEYNYEFAPSESNAYETVLVYMYKKANLKRIESIFRDKKLLLRRIVSRYQILTSLIASDQVLLDSSNITILVDVSAHRVRVFFVQGRTIKSYRRIVLKLNDKKKADIDKATVDQVKEFLNSVISSYLQKNTNQIIKTIYILSDVIDFKLFKSMKLNQNIDIEPFEFTEPYKIEGKVSSDQYLRYFFGYYELLRSGSSFNLIPFLKRFEKIGLIFLLSVGIFALVINGVSSAVNVVSLSKEYQQFAVSLRGKNQQSRDVLRDLTKERNRLKEQDKIIGYVDLIETSITQMKIDEALFSLISLATSDIRFKKMDIDAASIRFSGSASAERGNYSFYSFLQQLDSLPFVSRSTYTLNQGAVSETSNFSVTLYLQ